MGAKAIWLGISAGLPSGTEPSDQLSTTLDTAALWKGESLSSCTDIKEVLLPPQAAEELWVYMNPTGYPGGDRIMHSSLVC